MNAASEAETERKHAADALAEAENNAEHPRQGLRDANEALARPAKNTPVSAPGRKLRKPVSRRPASALPRR